MRTCRVWVGDGAETGEGTGLQVSAAPGCDRAPGGIVRAQTAGLTPTVLVRSGVGPASLHVYPVLLSCTALSSALLPTLGCPVPSSQAEPGPGNVKAKGAPPCPQGGCLESGDHCGPRLPRGIRCTRRVQPCSWEAGFLCERAAGTRCPAAGSRARGGVPHRLARWTQVGFCSPSSCCLWTPAHAAAGLGRGRPGRGAPGPETPSLNKFLRGAGQTHSRLLCGVNQANEVPEREPGATETPVGTSPPPKV